MSADNQILVQEKVSFETEGRLLQELGERLVSRADVALVELIKNSYDADAKTCWITRSENEIVVMDDGHGISHDEFLNKWMRIATGAKQKEQLSRHYKRHMTGAKGIGRFAVRFLGYQLHLESVTTDPELQCRTRLVTDFNWKEIDKQSELRDAKIEYKILRVDEKTPGGTTLTIRQLRDPEKIDFGKTLRNQVLSIVSPIGGLDRGPFQIDTQKTKDPGFILELPGIADGDMNLASAVLSHYYARLIIEHKNDEVTFTITHKDQRSLLKRRFKYRSHISKGLHADIRYFPRRSDMFRDVEVKGGDAWQWIKDITGSSL